MIDDIAEKIAITNPLQLERSDKQKFYSDILVKLLNASAAGMFPSKPYIKSDDVKGYIIVRNDGEVVCYDFYEQNVVDKHLHDNTKFDTPSSEKKNKNGEYQRTPYCRLYRNDKGELEIQLNFQIRWT
jgi:type II restriction enzyme